MEKDRGGRVIAIVALLVGVVGLTIGFAAFTNTLTIQSDASVTPDDSLLNRIIHFSWFHCVGLDEDELEVIKSFNLITAKPIIYVANVSEDDLLGEENKYVQKVREIASKENAAVVFHVAFTMSVFSILFLLHNV